MGVLGEFTRVESISSEGVVWGTGVEHRDEGDKVAIGLEIEFVFFLSFLDKPIFLPRTMMVETKFKILITTSNTRANAAGSRGRVWR